MSAAHQFEVVLLLLALVIGLELLARRVNLPSAAALIVGGIGLALVPGMPQIQLDPDLALVLFLPPLLMASAYVTVWRDFVANLRIILQLAVGAVLFTTLAVGVVTHWVAPALPWAACFALGAIVSPPDAVAAKAVLARVKLPPRVVVLLEGESLLNDATGIVLFRVAVAAGLTGTFSVGEAAVSFGMLSAGGVLAGGAFGFVTMAVLGRLRDPVLVGVTSLLAAWVSYIGAEALHVSGVLSTVACGLVIGVRQHRVLDAATRTQTRAVWQAMGFVLESLVFILIGLSLRGVLARLGGTWDSIISLLPAVAAIVGAVVVSRFIWMIAATYIPRALIPALRRRDPYPPLAVPIVLSWAGMRGVVSLAIALSLPQGFPGRDFILATTFAVILVTVLVQGVTLGPLIRLLKLGEFKLKQSETMAEHEARARVAQAQLDAVNNESEGHDGAHRHPRLVEQYAYRARASARFSTAPDRYGADRAEHFRVVLAAIAAGRAELLRLHETNEVHDTVLHALEEELDLEEMSARRFEGEEQLGSNAAIR